MFNLGEKTTSYETFIRLLNNIFLCTFQLLLEGLKNIYVTEKNFYFADEIKIIFTRKNAFKGKFFIMLNNDHYKSVLNSAKFKKKYFLYFIRCNKIWLLNAIIRVFYCLNFFAIHVYVYWYWTNSNLLLIIKIYWIINVYLKMYILIILLLRILFAQIFISIIILYLFKLL